MPCRVEWIHVQGPNYALPVWTLSKARLAGGHSFYSFPFAKHSLDPYTGASFGPTSESDR